MLSREGGPRPCCLGLQATAPKHRPINLRNPLRIALSFRAKPCSVSTRVDRFRVAEKGTPYGAERPPRGRRPATPGGQAVAGPLRRGLRRDDAGQQQDLADPPHRLAAAGPGRGRPVRTRPPPRRGAGQRRRPAHEPAPTQARRRAPATAAPAAAVGPPRDRRLPPVGSVLARVYRGQTLQVRVLADGFEFEGAVYPSLSAVAKAITGSHCNGFLFFRLAGKGGDR